MNVKRNYSRELDELIGTFPENTKPKLLLHACCAPCSTAVLEQLNDIFTITLLYYNPNISPKDEYIKRQAELVRLVEEMKLEVEVIESPYEPECFKKISVGLEAEPEGGSRCESCYEMRLKKAAEKARELNCDYFTTTLSISPMKSSETLNEIGEKVEKETGVRHLPSDFKKKEGYKRSIELSKKHDLYRQDYCGCKYSKQQSEKRGER